MPIQINPSKIPIWVDENQLQLGTEAHAQVLQHVTNGQERLIELLFNGVAKEQLGLVGESVGLTAQESNELVEALRPSLLREPSGSQHSTPIDVRFAELIRIGFKTGQAPGEVLANRAKYTIHIEKLNRTGLTLIRVLSEIGFRTFTTDDFGLVGGDDEGELGYPPSLRGVARSAAVRALLELNPEKISLEHQTRKQNSAFKLSIITGNHRLMPTDYRNLKNAHVAIEYRIEATFISGVTVPGKTPCLGCRELWFAEHNPGWFSNSVQLLSRGDTLDDGQNLLVAVAQTAKNICEFVDFGTFGMGYNLELENNNVVEQSHQFHPGCSCKN